MTKPPRDVTAAELAILEQLWLSGQSTVKDLAQSLYGASTASDIATVQKLLTRLEAKDYVGRDRQVWPHLFQATLTREQLILQRLQGTADELCNGTLATLLSHLVRSDEISAGERKRLRKLLEEGEKP